VLKDRSIATIFFVRKQVITGRGVDVALLNDAGAPVSSVAFGRSYVSLDVRAASRLRSSIFAGCFFSEHSRRN